jgi:Zn-finger protein
LIVNKCQNCNVEYIPKRRGKQGCEQKYCSFKCSTIARTGEKLPPFTEQHIKNMSVSQLGHHNSPTTEFKKGLTPHNKGNRDQTNLQYSIRQSIKMKDWRKEIFLRDNYTCRDCGLYGGTFNAHHINGVALLIKQYNINSLFDAENVWSFGTHKMD